MHFHRFKWLDARNKFDISSEPTAREKNIEENAYKLHSQSIQINHMCGLNGNSILNRHRKCAIYTHTQMCDDYYCYYDFYIRTKRLVKKEEEKCGLQNKSAYSYLELIFDHINSSRISFSFFSFLLLFGRLSSSSPFSRMPALLPLRRHSHN